MTTETILSEADVRRLKDRCGVIAPDDFFKKIVREVEQAVLQSPEIQALRKDAKRMRWIEEEGGVDIVMIDANEWEVSGGDIYGTGATIGEAIDDAMEQ